MGRGLFALALVLAPSALLAQALPDNPNNPSCKVDRHGDRLVTAVEYPDGYIVEAPWRILEQRNGVTNGNATLSVLVSLDRVVEYDPVKKERVATPFPGPVQMLFEADSEDGILQAAAEVWCSTVAHVRENETSKANAPKVPFRITALPEPHRSRA